MIKTTKEIKDNYIIVTDKWLRKGTSNNHKVIDRNYFADSEGNIYKVDGKYVVLDYFIKEKEIANWFVTTFGGTIYMVPRVNKPKKVQTPDYLFKGEHWDLKEIFGDSKQVIYHAIYAKKGQSSNFIIDITKSKLSFDMAKIQVSNLYKRTDLPFIKKIILKDNSKFIVYKRK